MDKELIGVTLSTGKWMDMDSSSGKTEMLTKDNSRIIKSTVSANITANKDTMRDCIKKGNDVVKEKRNANIIK